MVSKLVKKVMKNPELFHEIIEKKKEQQSKRDEIADYITALNDAGQVIDSVKKLQHDLKEEKDMEVKYREMASIMKKDLGMRFKKIQSVSVRTNSEKNLVLRQQFAVNLIQVLNSGKRVLNVDQTWLGMSDFRKMKWRPKDSTNSIPKLSMLPRITMFVGLDTDGEVYLSLL